MDFISQPFIILIIFYFIYAIIELIIHRKERIMLVDKLDTLSANDKAGEIIKFLLEKTKNTSFKSIRWGFLLCGLGVGLLGGFSIRLGVGKMPSDLSDLLLGGCILCFGGIGLIVSYLIEKKQH